MSSGAMRCYQGGGLNSRNSLEMGIVRVGMKIVRLMEALSI